MLEALNYHLYRTLDGGAAGAGDGGSAGGTSDGPESGAPETAAQEPETTAGQQDAQKPVDRQAAFDAFINENRDLYEERVKTQLSRRFKTADAAQEKLAQAEPILTMLAQKYNVDGQDYGKLLDALEKDSGMLEEEAIERGMSVDDLKTFKRLERENAQLKRAEETRARQQREGEARQRIDAGVTQAKQKYPGFDMRAEVSNPNFRDLIGRGIDVTTAYEIIHKDELLTGAIGYAAQKAAKATADNIATRANRPSENGVQNQAPAKPKPQDPSKLTRAEINELTRRALAGERITFG